MDQFSALVTDWMSVHIGAVGAHWCPDYETGWRSVNRFRIKTNFYGTKSIAFLIGTPLAS